MKRITTLAAVLATGAIAASPALGDDHARDTHAREAAGSPFTDPFPYRAFPALPADLESPATSAPAVPADGGGSNDGRWLLLGGLVAAGFAGGTAAGMARRHRVRARRVAV